MATLSEIRPIENNRIIDLANSAGVDVSDWANCHGGESKAASNPKYCYEWAFIQPNHVVVLCLWYSNLREANGKTIHTNNFRRIALDKQADAARKGRALRADEAIIHARRYCLPIRVVVCDGKIRDRDHAGRKASSVKTRLLDPVPWAVTAYDESTGDCTLTRAAVVDRFVDQFSVDHDGENPLKRQRAAGEVYARSERVRMVALKRANGCCEWCGERGFETADGSIYLETHHVIPLCDGGSDTISNVVALCPNHHREAHCGKEPELMRSRLLDVASAGKRQSGKGRNTKARKQLKKASLRRTTGQV